MPKRDIFISYASENVSLARAACSALETAGLRCWLAARDVPPGSNYFDDVFPAIKNVRLLVLILTPHAFDSRHVLREVIYADDCNLPLIFLRVVQQEPPVRLQYFLTTSQWLDAFSSPPAEAHLPRLAAAAADLLAADRPATRGQRFGNYEVMLREDGSSWELGCGIMGVSYKALPADGMGTPVALKALKPQVLREPAVRAEFQRRAETALALHHPGAARLVDVGLGADGAPFYATEFVEGESLYEEVLRTGPFDVAKVWAVMGEVAATLAAAWAGGLMHGDLKPTNLRRDAATGALKVVDFGLLKGLEPSSEDMAMQTAAALTLDNPAYASPERCLEQPLDVRSDLYSLGAVAWFLLTGRPLFTGPMARVIEGHLSDKPPLAGLTGVPSHLVGLLERLLAKRPEGRPADPAALLAEMAIGEGRATLPAPPALAVTAVAATESERTVELDEEDLDLFATIIGNPAEAPPEPQNSAAGVSAPSDLYGHYQILRRGDGSLFELGRGAMAITYKAIDSRLKTFAALKVINAAYYHSMTARARFQREARGAASVHHRNVARALYFGESGENVFYAMEFVDGRTVADHVEKDGPFPVRTALEIAYQTTQALGAVNKAHLVHRDIKPANLMLVNEADGEMVVKVIDFGLARQFAQAEGDGSITTAGFVGTPHFMSPEQLEENDLDIRSDIYSLGATLWYMLTGKPMFSGSMTQIFVQHLTRQPPFERLKDFGVPNPVVELLACLLAKDTEGRPQTPVELRRRLTPLIRSFETTSEEPATNPGPAVATQSAAAPETEAESDPRAFETVAAVEEPPPEIVSERPPPPVPVPLLPLTPPLPVDTLTFSAHLPGAILPASSFILDIWAHRADQAMEVRTHAAELNQELESGRKGPANLAHGTLLSVNVTLEGGFALAESMSTLLWVGEIARASFPVNAPAALTRGFHTGRAVIRAEGVTIARLVFQLYVGSEDDTYDPAPQVINGMVPRTAFASYASPDRDAVLARLRGIKKLCPALEIFDDVMALHSGQDWQRRLTEQVLEKDVLFLFWSREAARSHRVAQEWRQALARRGSDYIDPVPLQDPEESPPPEELRELHFRDSFLAYQRGRRGGGGGWLGKLRRIFGPKI